jgi:hypothetical protein
VSVQKLRQMVTQHKEQEPPAAQTRRALDTRWKERANDHDPKVVTESNRNKWRRPTSFVINVVVPGGVTIAIM